MKYTDKTDKLEEYIRNNLKESRYLHSLGVEKMARHLAGIHGADEEKAAFAGRYHDIAKCKTAYEMNNLVRKYQLSEEYLDNPALAHSKVGAALLKYEFGVNDKDIINAVSSHTTGRAGMSLLEEIIYVSDAIDETRSYGGIEELRKQAETDLDGACLFIMDFTIDKLKNEGRTLDKITLDARDFIYNRIIHK